MVTEAQIEAALRLVQAPPGGLVLAAEIRGENLALLVDYGIGGVKKWVMPIDQIPAQQAADSIPVAPPVKPPAGRKRNRKK